MDKKLNGNWVEHRENIMNLNLKYMVSGSDLPKITICCKKVYEQNDVWKINDIYGDMVDRNLDPDVENILEEKIDSLLSEHRITEWSADFWKNKILAYVRRIGEIYNKQMNGVELNIREIELIYRLVNFRVTHYDNFPIKDYISFGTSPDPRMEEIISQRNHKDDFEKISSASKLLFLKKHDFFDIKVSEPKLVIESGKIEYASDELLKDLAFVKKFLTANKESFILPYTKANINKNKNVVLLQLQNLVATSIDNLLMYVSPKLQDDMDVVRLAVMINGNNIRYASNRLKNDRFFVILALLNECDVVEENFPLTMLETYPEIKNIVDVIDIINVYSKIDDEEVKRVLSNNIINLIKHSPPEIRSSYKIMKKAFAMNPEAINFANARVQGKLRGK